MILFLICGEIAASMYLQINETIESSTLFFSRPDLMQIIYFLIVAVLGMISLFAIFFIHIKYLKNRQLFEKLHIEKELYELRISYIRQKVIPHFNSNVLAAIEYNMVNSTKEETMRIFGIYSDFTLKTLSDIDKATRPLHEELAYAKMYLNLEKVRFLNKFNFRINIEKGVDEFIQLPNMILHTYCENAVNHGIMPFKTGGLITINISQVNKIVCLCVEDNGVGRSYAVSNPQPNSTRKSLSIIERQVEIYNSFNTEKITQKIEDILDSNGQPSGTRFIFKAPSNYTYTN